MSYVVLVTNRYTDEALEVKTYKDFDDACEFARMEAKLRECSEANVYSLSGFNYPDRSSEYVVYSDQE